MFKDINKCVWSIWFDYIDRVGMWVGDYYLSYILYTGDDPTQLKRVVMC